MNIDTNLKINTDTNLKLNKPALKNLDIDKTAILRPNNSSGTTFSNPIDIKLPQNLSFDSFLKDLMATFYSEQLKNRKELPTLTIDNGNLHPLNAYDSPGADIKDTLEGDIRYCIINKVRAELDYNGGKRTIEIYCWGQNTANHDVIRVFQLSGHSNSGQQGFKIFLVNKIEGFKILYGQRFLMQVGYKRNDEEMKKIYLQL